MARCLALAEAKACCAAALSCPEGAGHYDDDDDDDDEKEETTIEQPSDSVVHASESRHGYGDFSELRRGGEDDDDDHMPNKPSKYGIKICVAFDAQSSDAWNMQVYIGRTDKLARPEKDLASCVVMDLTERLPPARNITCDNFFTSQAFASRLWNERRHTLLGTIRKNRLEIPGEFRCVKGRSAGSVVTIYARPAFGGPKTTLLSYVPKKNKNMLLLTTCPDHTRVASSPSSGIQQQQQQQQQRRRRRREDRAAGKPAMVLHYNRTKGGVDNLDKVAATYSCRQKTCRWPVALFHNMVDVAGYNAFVLWRELRPEWMTGKRNRRRVFLESVGHALVAPLREARTHRASSSSSAAG